MEILEPLQQYKSEFRDKHRQLTEEYFDRLVEESGIYAEENASLMNERSQMLTQLRATTKSVKMDKSSRALLIFCTVLLLLAALITAIVFADKSKGLVFLAILLPVLTGGGAVALIFVITQRLNKKIKGGSANVRELNQKVSELEKKGWEQMRPLNVKYGWNIPDRLIFETVPHIQLDKYFDEDKHDFFKRNFGLNVAGRQDISVYCARSGNSCGNPFLLIRYFVREIVQHTYRGTLTVSWTERYTGSDGKMHTRTVSQTLVATVVKPKPEYFFSTCLYYGNDAAPDLNFSRNPTVPRDATDKKIASIIKSGEKRFVKKSREAVKNGKSFNMLANSEFEVLFGAEDRNNETQFRMMFTPLAQQNIVELLRNKEPYGDDFTFEKKGKVNVIYSSHGADLDIDANPSQFAGFDLAEARKNFIRFNAEYFASLYFDFAPLFSIPIYQQERPSESFGECTKHSNIGDFEMESVANYFKKEFFAPLGATTPQILKAVPVKADEQGTLSEITSYSYRGEDRVSYVPVMANNGRVYSVAVPWVEYIPVQKSSQVYMQAVNLTREQYLTNSQATDKTVLVGGVKAKFVQ